MPHQPRGVTSLGTVFRCRERGPRRNALRCQERAGGPDGEDRDAAIRDKLVAILEARIAGSDGWTPTRHAELRGALREKPGLHRYLRVTKAGLLRVDRAKITDEADLDGRFLLRTSDRPSTLPTSPAATRRWPTSNGAGAT